MLRKSFSIALVIAMVAFVALGRQATEEEQLRQQLLSQEEFQTLQGEQWILDSLSDFGDVGALASAVGTYLNTSNDNIVVTGLIHFESVETAGAFVQGQLELDEDDVVRNLRDELAENPEVLTELIANSTDDIFVVEVANNPLQLLFMRRGNLVFVLQTSSIELAQLVLIADAQVQKTLDFCANADPAPGYC
jgi:hypothetical protein